MHWAAPVAAGIVFWNGLYLMLRSFLLRAIFDPLFKKYYKPPRAHKAASNGTADGHAVPNGVPPSPKTQLTDAEVVELSERVVTFVFNVVIAACSVVFMWQARDDVKWGKSSFLVPATHFTTPYFVHDFRAMYHSVVAKKNLYKRSFAVKFFAFLKKNWAFAFHHAILVTLGYPLAIDTFNWRRGMGEFLIGAFFAHDFANCFLVVNQTMKAFNCHKTRLAMINGAVGIIFFFLCRVIKWPLVILLYAAQYHNYSMIAALMNLHKVCWICTGLDMALCLYWFKRILEVASKSFKADKPKED